jgi:hypothetical protein
LACCGCNGTLINNNNNNHHHHHHQSVMIIFVIIIVVWLLAGQPGLYSYFGTGFSLYYFHSITEVIPVHPPAIFLMTVELEFVLNSNQSTCKLIKISRSIIHDHNTFPYYNFFLHGLSPRANYTDRATATCRRNDCQLLLIEGATWSA